jgi:signal transduction histidine kinase
MVRLAAALSEAVLVRLTAEEPGDPRSGEVTAVVERCLRRGLLVRLEAACNDYHDQLLNRMRDAQQSERQRIGRELHDRLGHDLSAAYRGLESFEAVEECRAQPVDRRVVRSREAVRSALEYVRALAYDLQLIEPVASLGPALRGVADTVPGDQVTFRVAVNGDETWATPEVLDEVFLVLREAMRNAYQHAKSASVLVRVNVAPDELHAIVEDQGIGFDARRRRGRGSGSGIHAMSERARLLGGRLTISRTPGGGSRVELSVPLGAAETSVVGQALR